MKIIDIHIHGGFGIDFNKTDEEGMHFFARQIKNHNVVAFCPTLATDKLENISTQISIIKRAMQNQKKDEAKILGVHLEGCFLNPNKSGIQDPENFYELTPENFLKIQDNDVIKIVTLAPELDLGLIDFLISYGVKVHAGHTQATECGRVHGTTHHFNAMPPIHHRVPSITLDALFNDKIYCEIIADFSHIFKDVLKLFFKTKKKDKIILVSDALPITKSDLETIEFCGKTIYKNGLDANKTLAGSIKFLDEISENLIKEKFITRKEAQKMLYDNVLAHLDLKKL